MPFVASHIALAVGKKRPNAAGWLVVASIFASLACILVAAKDALALATVAIFTFAHYVRNEVGSTDLDSLKALGRAMPASSFAAAVAFFSVIGVPPPVGFLGKLYLFTSAITVAPRLAVIGIINGRISAGYYAIVLKQLYFATPRLARLRGELEEITDPEVIAMLLCAVLSAILGLGFAPYLAATVTPQ